MDILKKTSNLIGICWNWQVMSKVYQGKFARVTKVSEWMKEYMLGLKKKQTVVIIGLPTRL